jgi:hypothetical protein
MRHARSARIVGIVGWLGVGLSPVVAAAPARACGNAVMHADGVVGHLVEADTLLAAGTTTDALRILRRVRATLDDADGSYAWDDGGRFSADREEIARIEVRVATLLAVAIVRRDGAVDRRSMRPLRRVRPPARESALRWAVTQLAAAAGADPLARARYAEAQSHLPDLEGEALATLTDLANRDLVPDAWGWRALATIRERRGETGPRDQALARCRTAAGAAAATVCPAVLLATR